MRAAEIIVRFLVRFVASGFPPHHGHDSAKHKDAVISQPANRLYIDCGHDMEKTEAVLGVCVKEGWIVAPFGLALGLGINQETFEATQAGVDKAHTIIAQLDEVTGE